MDEGVRNSYCYTCNNTRTNHEFCMQENNKKVIAERRAFLLSQHPWLTEFLNKYAQWQETHDTSKS